MVKPVALRITATEAKLVEAWLAKLRKGDPDAKQSDVLRLALVLAGRLVLDHATWIKVAKEGGTEAEWTASVVQNEGPIGAFELQWGDRLSSADRAYVRRLGAEAMEEGARDLIRDRTCSKCGNILSGAEWDSNQRCPKCNQNLREEEPDDVAF